MEELIAYAVALLAVLGHGWAAAHWYKKIHQNTQLSFRQKNALKLRALTFPIGLWWATRSSRKG